MALGESSLLPQWTRQIASDGFAVISEVFTASEFDDLIVELERVLFQRDEVEGPIRDRKGTIFAGRNLLSLFAPVCAPCMPAPTACGWLIWPGSCPPTTVASAFDSIA